MRLRPMCETTGQNMSVYVDHTGEPLRAWSYARVPWEVVCDRQLKPLDIRVYCMISGPTFQATTAKVGMFDQVTPTNSGLILTQGLSAGKIYTFILTGTSTGSGTSVLTLTAINNN